MIEQINRLENYFERMEEEKKVDNYLEKTLLTIEKIRERLKKLDKELLLKKESPKQIFELHHLINVNLLIFNSMYERLKVAKEKKDNPIIAINSLNIIPFIREGINNINKLKNDELNLDLAMSLQMIASRNNLFNFQNQKKRKNLGKTFGDIADGIDLTI